MQANVKQRHVDAFNFENVDSATELLKFRFAVIREYTRCPENIYTQLGSLKKFKGERFYFFVFIFSFFIFQVRNLLI